ncbi:MAG: inner-rane translocator [Ilumatobacteraceae bacterium]|nr:inner-rane translocator [Ilumatobacteraceae bacterium]
MTAVVQPETASPDDESGGLGAFFDRASGATRIALAIVGALIVFGVVMWMKGANPFTAYHDMLSSTFHSWDSVGDILVRATPIILAALAVSVPARAGLINVGGEGQMLMGGIGAFGVSLLIGGSLPGKVTLLLMILGAAALGALWAGLAAVLRQFVGISESVTTLLLNYIALDAMYFLIYDRWKDRHGSGQPATKALPVAERLPLLFGRVHDGILLAIGAAVIIGLLFALTSWGFRLRVVGGNAEAARRSGLKVGALLISAMAVGGALAGIGGLTQLAGAEFKLRSGFIAGYGYIGFLASWLGRHRPGYVVLSAVLLSAIVIGGDSLQIDSKLPAASVNVLMAVTLLMVFGFGRKKAAA